jgi:hypothetical protein
MPIPARAVAKSFDAAACGNLMSSHNASTKSGSFRARFSASRPTSVICSTKGAVGVPPVTGYLTMSGRYPVGGEFSEALMSHRATGSEDEPGPGLVRTGE